MSRRTQRREPCAYSVPAARSRSRHATSSSPGCHQSPIRHRADWASGPGSAPGPMARATSPPRYSGGMPRESMAATVHPPTLSAARCLPPRTPASSAPAPISTACDSSCWAPTLRPGSSPRQRSQTLPLATRARVTGEDLAAFLKTAYQTDFERDEDEPLETRPKKADAVSDENSKRWRRGARSAPPTPAFLR